MDALAAATGVDVRTRLVDELKSAYDTFLASTIPPGDAPLDGTEAVRVAAFKDALGLADEDAAPVHLDVGRRFARERYEAGSRAGAAAGRAALAKLIYVSALVFGEQKAAFMLPWRRVFGLTDAQLAVAKRDCAKSLLRRAVAAAGGLAADKPSLEALERARVAAHLADDVAADEIRAAAHAALEARLAPAVDPLNAGAAGASARVAALDAALAYARALTALKGAPGVPPGVVAPSVHGGPLETGPPARALRETYAAWLDAALDKGAWTDALAADAADAAAALALGAREGADARASACLRAYDRALKADIRSGALASAPSKAAHLSGLCDTYGVDADAAASLHKDLYTAQAERAYKTGRLSDADAASLERARVSLCIPKATVAAVSKATAGKVYADAVAAALAAGADGFSQVEEAAVADARASVRLDASVAKDILTDAVRKTLLGYVTRSRTKRDRESAGKELREMVILSNVVVAPLLKDLASAEDKASAEKAADVAAAKAEIAEIMKEAAGQKEDGMKAPAPPVDTSAAPLSAADVAATPARSTGGPPSERRPVAKDAGATGQKAITLADDFERRDRIEIYRQFLLFCLSGEEVKQPFGGTVTLERDPIEFTRLSQLGDILGLGPLDVAGVQSELAETAFRNQAQQAIGGGALTPEAAARLEDIRQKMGLSKEASDKVLKSVLAEKAVGGLQAAQAAGSLTLKKLLDMKDAGVDLATAVNGELRMSLYTADVARALSDGRGDFNADRMLKTLPSDLGLDPAKAQAAVDKLVADKRRLTLVQAVAHLRQKDVGATVASTNNLLAAQAASPAAKPLEWTPAAELENLYTAYAGRVADPAKRAGVRALLGIAESDAARLEAGAAAADPLAVVADEEEALF